jgi:hypothetical protein
MPGGYTNRKTLNNDGVIYKQKEGAPAARPHIFLKPDGLKQLSDKITC